MITSKEMRRLLRLMRDACLSSGSHEDKRRSFVAGLGGLIGADFAEWVEVSENARGSRAECELRIPCKPIGELLFSRRTQQPFSKREATLARWMAAEFLWTPSPSFNARSGLTRRERLILDLLLQSHGRKEIAKRLGISVNTVQGYIKAIYLNFGVHSHPELLRHYFQTRGSEPVSPKAPPDSPLAEAVEAV